jgi:hypothetical protein
MPSKALIVLQENTGDVPLDPSVPNELRPLIKTVVDGLAETFEDVKTTLQAAGRYDIVHLLTDNSCSRARLLDCLVLETKNGRAIDLIVLGHGRPEELILKTGPNLTGGPSSNIRTLKADARKKGVRTLNLRMVYMCNCFASTVNDDWLAIGANVSIGSKQLDMMPEPMTTFFVHNWLNGQTANQAASNAYQATIPFFLPFYPPVVTIKYKTITWPYPCPTPTNWLKTCTGSAQVPDGITTTPHTYVQQTELVVSGSGGTKF